MNIILHKYITIYQIIIIKKGVVVNSLDSFQARHQFFDWKLETRRERVPSAPLAFLWKSKKPN
jgi:hypothetical protein